MDRSLLPPRFSATASIAVLLAAACTGQTYTPPSGSLFLSHTQKQAYFDSIHVFTPDSVFYHEGGEYAEYQKWFRAWETRIGIHGDFLNYDRLQKTYCESSFHDGSSFKSNIDPWIEIGPKRKGSLIGIGPIRNIVLNKDEPDHMLTTSSTGGLFYTDNGGTEWFNGGTDVGWPHSGCQDAVYYPGPNSTEKWFALSAYGSGREGRIGLVGGVFRTTDSGSHWDRIADWNDFISDLPAGANLGLQKLLFDEKSTNNDHTLFLATEAGLFKCADPCSYDPTWSGIDILPPTSLDLAFPGYQFAGPTFVRDMEYLPIQGTSIMCAGVRFEGSLNNNIVHVWRFMRSDDNGESWYECPGQPAINTSYSTATVETTPANDHAFYCLFGAPSSISAVWTYSVTDDTWSSGSLAAGFAVTYGDGHTFAVSSTNPNSILVGHTGSGGVGHLKWYLNGVGYNYTSNASRGHDDLEDILPDPTNGNQFWIANHGGVIKLTVDPNSHLTSWTDYSTGLGVAEVNSLSTSQNVPDYIATGLFHDFSAMTFTPYSATNWDPDWVQAHPGGDGLRCLFDRQDPDYLFTSHQQNLWLRHTLATTSPASGTWLPANAGIWWSEGDLNRQTPAHIYRADKVFHEITQVANQQGTLIDFYNYEIEVQRSFDRGSTTEIISNFRSNPNICKSGDPVWGRWDHELIYWIHTTPSDPNHLYVALRNWDWQERIFRTTLADNPDASAVAASWEEVPHPRRVGIHEEPRDARPASIAFDPDNRDMIYLAYTSSKIEDPDDLLSLTAKKMVFKMDLTQLNQYPPTGHFDCGGSIPCEDLTMNLPNTVGDQDALVFEQGSNEGLYLATEAGVYYTDRARIAAFDPNAIPPVDPDDLNNSSGWVRLGGALPHCASRGMEANYNINRLRIGLYGRGVWEHHLHCPSELDQPESGAYLADEFVESRSSISSTALVPPGIKVKYRAGEQVHLTPGFRAQDGAVFHAFIHPCDAQGNSFQAKRGSPSPPVPIEQTETLASLRITPNPNAGLFTVSVGENAWVAGAKGSMTVFDTTGRQIHAQPITRSNTAMDMRGRSGLFVVLVQVGDEKRWGRVVVD